MAYPSPNSSINPVPIYIWYCFYRNGRFERRELCFYGGKMKKLRSALITDERQPLVCHLHFKNWLTRIV